MILSDTDIVWHWHWLSSEIFEFLKFIDFIFFRFRFFVICFLIWKKIKETDKNWNKGMYCSLRKQWLIQQQLLSYWIATRKIDKIFDFKAKSYDLEKHYIMNSFFFPYIKNSIFVKIAYVVHRLLEFDILWLWH